jgi:hypothetical protein
MVFPWLVMGIGATLVAVLLWRGQLKLEPGMLPLTAAQLLRLAWVPLAVVFFILAADLAGFVLAAGVMLLGLLLALRVRVVTAVILTLLFVPATYHVFAVQLGVPLPWGWLGW